MKASKLHKSRQDQFSLETNHHFAPLIIWSPTHGFGGFFYGGVTRETLADVISFHNLLQFSLFSLFSLLLTGLA